MKRLLLFIEGRDWTLPIGVTILALIYLVGMNVSASLTFDPAMREQLVIKQWFDTAGWLAVVFILTTYIELGSLYGMLFSPKRLREST